MFSNICENGRCLDTADSFICDCNPGYIYNPRLYTCEGTGIYKIIHNACYTTESDYICMYKPSHPYECTKLQSDHNYNSSLYTYRLDFQKCVLFQIVYEKVIQISVPLLVLKVRKTASYKLHFENILVKLIFRGLSFAQNIFRSNLKYTRVNETNTGIIRILLELVSYFNSIFKKTHKFIGI